MLQNKIAIKGWGSVSALGISKDEILNNYYSNDHFFLRNEFDDWHAPVHKSVANAVQELYEFQPKLKTLDKSVIYAILASLQAVKHANWNHSEKVGVFVGSSRGATDLFERYFYDYFKSGKVNMLTSPTTTLGNISSWISNVFGYQGFNCSHSVTCSSSLHAILNAVAWIQAGFGNRFLAGGSEAALSSFTIEQMKALKIYASNKNTELPCQSLKLDKSNNSMVLGEGAILFALENGSTDNSLAFIEGIGFSTETTLHHVSLSTTAESLQNSMKMALANINTHEVDAIIMHAPGTKLGDKAEFEAIKKIFGNKLPYITSNKWKIGHTLGASGCMSMEMALLMLKNNTFFENPFYSNNQKNKEINKVLINSVGFGGNAVSILITNS